MAVKLLESLGRSVIVVGNGKEAVSVVGQQDFDLVLMAVQMPVMQDRLSASRPWIRWYWFNRHLSISAGKRHLRFGFLCPVSFP